MKLPGAGGQQKRDRLYDASGTTTGAAQLILPEHKSRSFLFIQNLHGSAIMFVEIGGARATVTITAGGALNAFTVTNVGFNYTRAPRVWLYGGGDGGDSSFVGATPPAPDYPAPGDAAFTAGRVTDLAAKRPGIAVATLGSGGTAGQIASIAVSDPGAGYKVPPLVFLENDLLDPNGAATPSATSGFYLGANGGSIRFDASFCPTEAVALFSSTSSAAFICKYAP